MNRRCFRYELGILLILVQILNLGAAAIPPGTLGLVILQTILHMDIIRKPWNKFDICISADSVLYNHEYKRLFLSALEHGDDMHLYYNMVSLILKGRQLEKVFGLIKYLFIMLFLTLFTSLYYIGISYVMYRVSQNINELQHCAIGFSAVLFAMKTIIAKQNPQNTQQVMNINVKSNHAPWFELLLIHLMIPNSSFKGHLSGILVGITYSDTFIGKYLDKTIEWILREKNEINIEDDDTNSTLTKN